MESIKAMWIAFQIIIVLAVLFSDAAWHWSNNGYATGLLAVFAAYAVTCLVYSFRNWRSEMIPRCFMRGHEGRETVEQCGGLRRELRDDLRE